MEFKKFDKELYNKADPLTNSLMANWLDKNVYTDIDLTETYGVDITCKKDNITCYFETELSFSWKDDWPNYWLSIHVPYRKKKIIKDWVRKGSSDPLTFVMFRKNCKQAWFMDGQTVRDAPVKVIDTSIKKNDTFYCINVNDARLINMENIDVPENLINRKYPS